MIRVVRFGLFILLTTLSSCTIELEDYMDQSASFFLLEQTTNAQTGLTEGKTTTLEVNSEKWKKLIEWGENHQKNWTPSLASHIGDIYVSQKNFKLSHTKYSKGVVIMFNDQEGVAKQYLTGIEEGELDFLYDL